jgi:hypothetical protein
MTNEVLSSLPTFFMCTFKLHKTIIKQIDKYRKHCLWRGSDINARTRPKAAWELVCLPKSEGGLRVINLDTQYCLIVKEPSQIFQQRRYPMGAFGLGKLLQKGNCLITPWKGLSGGGIT